MTRERARVLLVALAVLAAAAHVAAQQGLELPPPVATTPRPPEAPAPLPPQISAPGVGVVQEAPPARSVQPPVMHRPVDPPAAAPTSPNAAPARTQRPPAFRVIGQTGQPAPPERSPPNPSKYTPPASPEPPDGAAQTPALSLDVAEMPRAGQTAAYEIRVRNVGRTLARGARLEDELPPGARLVAAQPMPQVQGQRLAWEVDPIAPGGEQRFRVELIPGPGMEANSRATLTVTASASRAVSQRPAAISSPLSVGIAGPASVTVGHLAPFEIRVSNQGSVALSRVSLGAALPPGLEHVFGPEIETGFETLAAGETRKVQLELIAVQSGRYEIQVNTRAEGGHQAGSRAAVAVTEDPVLTLRLSGPRDAAAGVESDYRLEVTNRSAAPVRGVTLMKGLPPGVDHVHSERGTFDASARAVRWQVGPLAPGQTQMVTVRLVARNAGPAIARVVALTDQGQEARLHQVMRFRPPAPRGKN